MIGRGANDDAQSFEEAWNGGTPRDETIADLVRFAEDLCEAAAVEPSLSFRDDLRGRLMTEAATTLVAMPGASRPVITAPRTIRPGRRRIAALAATLIASAGAVSLVASSASALPGDMLYPVKRTVESVESTLHRSDSNRGAFQLAQASERLAEARKLSAENASPQLITEALDSFSKSATTGSTKLFNDFTESGQEKSVRKVNDFAAASNADLTALSGQLPAGATEALTGAMTAATDAVSKLATQATTLCLSCVSSDVQSLVNSVTNLAKDKPKPATPAANKNGGSKPSSPSGQTSKPAGGTPAKAPAEPATSAPAPTKPAPTPAATTKTPSLTDLTDPLLGGLLGDENQEGLVPGLLNGLLGGKK